MTGPIEVVLWVATAALDTDFTAKLIDVYPPSQWYPLGYALNLTDTILRLRYRNGRDRAELAKPSEYLPEIWGGEMADDEAFADRRGAVELYLNRRHTLQGNPRFKYSNRCT